MHLLRPFVLLAAGLATLVSARSSTGDSVLVVVEPSQQDNYSRFFDGLKGRGYRLTFRSPKDEGPALIEYEEPAFAHVIVLASETKSFAKDITPQSLVQLLNLNTNLILGLSTKQTPLTSLAAEFNLILPPPGTPLISYFPKRSSSPSLIPITPTKNDAVSVLSKDLKPIWFSGVPQGLGTSPYLFPILHAPAQSFAAEVDGGSADAIVDSAEKGGEGLWAGSQLGVVTGFQASNGARVTWLGGVELLNDELAQKEVKEGVKSGNEQFAQDVAAWTFKESQVVRVDKVEHFRNNETLPREQYTTNDQLTYTIHLSKYNPASNKWEPYSGIKDLQLEFTMLDPHVRTSLPAVPGAPGKYSTTFRAPDRHGVYKFVVDWKRKGWSYVESSTTVAVVPPRHDGYPRFISAAWPYYLGAISTSVAFFLFSALWLAGEVKEKNTKGKGKTE